MAVEFHPLGYVQLLADHGVDYVIVGGVAGRMQGSSSTTQDLDIMPEPSPANLERLAWALSGAETSKKPASATAYGAQPLVEAVEFQSEELSSYRTAHGVIAVIMHLPGVGGYDRVIRNARRYASGDIVLHAANLDDIITSKETIGRAKDWRAMDALYEARDRLREMPDDYELTDRQLDQAAGEPDAPDWTSE